MECHRCIAAEAAGLAQFGVSVSIPFGQWMVLLVRGLRGIVGKRIPFCWFGSGVGTHERVATRLMLGSLDSFICECEDGLLLEYL